MSPTGGDFAVNLDALRSVAPAIRDLGEIVQGLSSVAPAAPASSSTGSALANAAVAALGRQLDAVLTGLGAGLARDASAVTMAITAYGLNEDQLVASSRSLSASLDRR